MQYKNSKERVAITELFISNDEEISKIKSRLESYAKK